MLQCFDNSFFSLFCRFLYPFHAGKKFPMGFTDPALFCCIMFVIGWDFFVLVCRRYTTKTKTPMQHRQRKKPTAPAAMPAIAAVDRLVVDDAVDDDEDDTAAVVAVTVGVGNAGGWGAFCGSVGCGAKVTNVVGGGGTGVTGGGVVCVADGAGTTTGVFVTGILVET